MLPPMMATTKKLYWRGRLLTKLDFSFRKPSETLPPNKCKNDINWLRSLKMRSMRNAKKTETQ